VATLCSKTGLEKCARKAAFCRGFLSGFQKIKFFEKLENQKHSGFLGSNANCFQSSLGKVGKVAVRGRLSSF
jgi:hypothetical protein